MKITDPYEGYPVQRMFGALLWARENDYVWFFQDRPDTQRYTLVRMENNWYLAGSQAGDSLKLSQNLTPAALTAQSIILGEFSDAESEPELTVTGLARVTMHKVTMHIETQIVLDDDGPSILPDTIKIKYRHTDENGWVVHSVKVSGLTVASWILDNPVPSYTARSSVTFQANDVKIVPTWVLSLMNEHLPSDV